jgi:hypothetical protein
MILVDANLLLYEDSLSEHHQATRIWWDKQLADQHPLPMLARAGGIHPHRH